MSNTETSRPLGSPVPDWTPPPAPTGEILGGRYVRLEPMTEAHAAALFGVFDGHDALWDYMGYGPFASEQELRDWIGATVANPGHLFYVIQDLDTGACGGFASYLRIDPGAGSIEVGNITFAPALQRTRAATETMALMMAWAFDAGYRRYEWKCNALNRPSRMAALRFGFSYEGVFRQAMVVKGRNRDTAWFAAIDSEWPALRRAFETWLDPDNFGADGQQLRSLRDLTRPILVATDPSL